MLIAVAFVPPRDATVAEFETAARSSAGAFWMWSASTGLVWWGSSLWWAIVPAVLVMHSATAWVTCKRLAQQRRRRDLMPRQPAISDREQGSLEFRHWTVEQSERDAA
jgi:hypothetical protein